MRFKIAVLVNRHKMTLATIANMTPAQIHHLAFYPRNKRGEMKPPVTCKWGKTPEEELAFLQSLPGFDPSLPHFARMLEDVKRRQQWQES